MSGRQSGPSGLGGWLVLVMLGLFLSLGRMVFDLWTVHGSLLMSGTLVELSRPEHPAYHPLWLPLFCVEVLANLSLLFYTAAVLVLMLVRSRHTPAAMIVWYLYGLALIIGDYFMWQLVPAAAAVPVDGELIRDLGRAVVVTLIWVPYFLRSRRVRNTFTKDWPRWPGRSARTLPPPLA